MLCILVVLFFTEISFGQEPQEKVNCDLKCEICKIMVGVSKPVDCRMIEDKNSTEIFPQNCQEVYDFGNHFSGMYKIQPHMKRKPFMVYCDMETKGGGWTLIQNRVDGSEDFYRNWKDYKHGFGNLQGEFWIGLDNIYIMTGIQYKNELQIELVDKTGKKFSAFYSGFSISTESLGYAIIELGDFTGDVADALRHNKNKKFTTKDMDQDEANGNCAVTHKGAWWYWKCNNCNLNGKYRNLPFASCEGMNWDSTYLYSKSRMLIRPYTADDRHSLRESTLKLNDGKENSQISTNTSN